jgi:predicted phosphohydrolase
MRRQYSDLLGLVPVLAGGAFVAVRLLAAQPADPGVTFVGAGDIANCQSLGPARATARLLDDLEGTVFTLGDHAYKHGDATELRDCYGPTWGRHKARTRPAVGNHDLLISRGRPYFDYFGANAGPDRRGYYSFDLGAWHLVSLNSEAPVKSGSPQITWLREDLAAHRNACVLAYWHVPLFSSAQQSDPKLSELWRVLYDAGVDVVLNGHEHAYERFAPQDDQGHADPSRGIREFIVGTGGGALDTINQPAANNEIYNDRTFGVLKLALKAHGYDWEFMPVAGQRFRDAGSAQCSPAR